MYRRVAAGGPNCWEGIEAIAGVVCLLLLFTLRGFGAFAANSRVMQVYRRVAAGGPNCWEGIEAIAVVLRCFVRQKQVVQNGRIIRNDCNVAM